MATSEVPAASSSTRSGLNYSTSDPSVTANVSVSDGCLVVRFEEMEFLPWDNPDNIVTAEVENIARRVKENLSPIFFLIGGPANVINMLVFYKQGLKERLFSHNDLPIQDSVDNAVGYVGVSCRL